MPVNVREAAVYAIVAPRELGVLDAGKAQHCGVDAFELSAYGEDGMGLRVVAQIRG